MQSPKLLVWRRVFDKAYQGEGAQDGPTAASWNSSYTGQPIPRDEMDEYFVHTIARIQALQPQRILEIGCGTGMILHRLAPLCAAYYGRDISSRAIAAIRQWMRPEDGFGHVDLAVQQALDPWGVEPGTIDTVVLNSVIQYFPDEAYLTAVLQRAFETLTPGGHIFAGDIIHPALLPAFHVSVQLSKAPADMTAGALRQRIAELLQLENELSVPPVFFRDLQQRLAPAASADILLTRGWSDNELTRYRYDVVLRTAAEPPAAAAETIAWDPGRMKPANLAADLAQRQPPALRVTGVPNARLARDFALLRRLETLDPAAPVATLAAGLSTAAGEHPEAFWALEETCGYTVKLGPATDPAAFDALLERKPG
jgi:SAM-dependent methyltransferase